MQRNNALKLYQLFPKLLFWRENRSQISQYLFELLSNLQLIAIIVSGRYFTDPNSNHETLNIFFQKLFDIVSTFKLMNIDTFFSNSLMVSIWIYFLVLILLVSLICWKYFKTKMVQNNLKILFTYWAQFHHTIAFWIINTFLISRTFNISLKENKIPEGILNIISITLNYLVAMISSAFCYDPLLTKNDFSSFNSSFQIFTLLFKTIMTPIFIFIEEKSILKWTFLSLSFVITAIRYELLLRKVPYYKYHALKFTACLAGCAFFISCTTLFLAILAKFGHSPNQIWGYIEILIISFSFKITDSRIHSLIAHYVSLGSEKLSTKSAVIKKLFALNYIIDNANFVTNFSFKNTHNLASIYLQAEIQDHQKSCKIEKCFCKTLSKHKISHNRNQGIINGNKTFLEFLLSLKNDLLASAIKRFKDNNDIKLLLAYSIFRKPKTFPKALFLIFDINKSKASFRQKILLIFISRYIEEQFSEISKNLNLKDHQKHIFFDIKRIVDYQQKSIELSSNIERYFLNYMELWDYYQRPNMMLAKFFEKVVVLESEADKIQRLWSEILKLYKHLDSISAFLYGLYLKSLRNAPNTADSVCNQRAKNWREFIKRFQCNQIIVCISMAKDNLGKILQISRNVQELGWSQNSVVGNDIKNIQPPYLRERHNIILHEYIENINKLDSFTSFSKESFLQSKEGFLVPVNVYVTIYPVVLNEPVYVGIISKRDINRDVMIIRSDGFVDCFSKEIGLILNLNPKGKTHLSQICQNFNQLNFNLFNIRQSVYQKDKANRENEKDQTPHEFTEKEMILRFNSFSDSNRADTDFISFNTKIQTHKILGDFFYCLFVDSKKYFQKIYESPTSPTYILPFARPEEPPVSPTLSNNPLLQSSRVPGGLKGIYSKDKILTGKLELKTIQDFISLSEQSDEGNNGPPTTKIRESIIKNETFGIIMSTDEKEDREPNKLMQKTNSFFEGKGINYKSKLEEAIYCVPQERSSKILNYTMILFISLCLGLVVVHLVKIKQLLDISLTHIDLISVAQKRSYELSEIYGEVNVITLINRGLISDKRHATLGLQSYSLGRIMALKENAKELNVLNNQIRNNIDYLLKDQALKVITAKYDVKRGAEGENIFEKLDSFEVVTEISNAATILGTIDMNSIDDNNPKAAFILSNSLNDILLENDHFTTLLINDTKGHLTSIKSSLINDLIIICVAMLPFLTILSFDMRKFLKKRAKIIELLLTIDETHLQSYLRIVFNLFQKVFSQNLDDYKHSSIEISKTTQVISLTTQNKETKRFTRKKINDRGLNTRLKWTIMFTLFCILGFSSVFVLLSMTYTKDQKNFLLQIDNMAEINGLLVDLSLLFTTTQKFIGSFDDNVFIRNKPIEEEIDDLLKNVRNIPNFFLSLTTDNKDTHTSSLNGIIIGNLCEFVKVPEYPDILCPILGGGTSEEGLIRLITYIVRGIEDSLNTYKSSNHTIETAKISLNLEPLVFAEQVTIYATKGYQLIQDILKEKLKQSILDKYDEILWIITGYIMVYAVLGSLLSLNFWRKMNKERDNWRKLMRHIPISIILNNSLLRNYLINNSENILDSIKHIL